ncbi:MAG: hypothetical protein LIO62_03175 [Clostridiales bacterium]|nr:hypothetical protein [Clostridiales bacterium]
MKKSSKTIINTICILMIVITSLFSVSAFASTKAGVVSIKPLNVNTTIGDVDKAYVTGYSSIFAKKGTSDNNYTLKVWVKDTTNSTTLSSKHSFTVNGTSTGHWIVYKSGVSYKVGDNIRFYGEQSGTSSKGLNYVIYGDKATL